MPKNKYNIGEKVTFKILSAGLEVSGTVRGINLEDDDTTIRYKVWVEYSDRPHTGCVHYVTEADIL